MAEMILNEKMAELEERLSGLHDRIRLYQKIPPQNLEQEIQALKKERALNRQELEKKLYSSKAEMVRALGSMYQEIQSIIQKGMKSLEEKAPGDAFDKDAEGKILLAEYALDFACQAADCSLQLSLEAMNAQLLQEQGEKGVSL